MSLDVDPCVDMYTYSCGGWLKNEKLPPSKSKYGAFSKIQDEIYDIMKEVCVPVRQLFKELLFIALFIRRHQKLSEI